MKPEVVRIVQWMGGLRQDLESDLRDVGQVDQREAAYLAVALRDAQVALASNQALFEQILIRSMGDTTKIYVGDLGDFTVCDGVVRLPEYVDPYKASA